MRLVDGDTGEVIASEVELADSFWGRLRGLMFRRRFPSGKAMLFRFRKLGHYGVHTSFMWFPIDLVYLDPDFKVVEIRERLKPWRFHRPKVFAKYLIELPAGTVDRVRLEVGRRILLEGKVFNPRED